MPLSVSPARTSESQQSSTWPISAMSAIEQPAFRSGRITCCHGPSEDVGGLRHEVHAAEDHVLRVGLGGDLRELVAVAGVVGEPDDFIALVVVPKQNDVGSQLGAGRSDAVVHGVVGLGKVVI